MDALSALKMVGAPSLAGPLPGAALGGGGATSISPADMQQLSSLLSGGSGGAGAISPAQLSQMSSLLQNGGATTSASAISPTEFPQASPGLELTGPGGVSSSDSSSFQNMLGGFVQEVSDKQAAAGQAVTGLLSGKNVSLHQAMISVEEASVSFQLMVEVRNRLLDSYQELMRMQV
jgi:flagellar hook-basal body complex protein FliE